MASITTIPVNNTRPVSITTPVTIIFGRDDAVIYDVSPNWTVHQLAEVIAKSRKTHASNILIRYGQQNLLCEYPLHEYSIGQVSTLKATINCKPRKCCAAHNACPAHESKLSAGMPTMPIMTERANVWDLARVTNQDDWKLSDDKRTITLVRANDGKDGNGTDGTVGDDTTPKGHTTHHYKTVRGSYGYMGHVVIDAVVGQESIDFRVADGFRQACVGLVPGSFANWNGLMGDDHGGFRLDTDTGAIVGKTATKGIEEPFKSEAKPVKQITFRVNFASIPSVVIWFDDKVKGMWTFEQLGLPTNEPLYPAISCASTLVPIELNAPAPAPQVASSSPSVLPIVNLS